VRAHVLIRKHYLPAQTGSSRGADSFRGTDGFYESFRDGRFTGKELLRRYCTLVYA
jgi:hypothetical protein